MGNVVRFFLIESRTLRRSAIVWLSLLLLTAPAVAEPSIDCSEGVTDGLNGHDFGLIDFGYNAQLIGSQDAGVRAGRIKSNNGSRLKTCDTRKCDRENRAGAKISQDPFLDISVPKKSGLRMNWQESGTLGHSGNRYDRVDTNSRTELSVSSEYSTYYIKRLSTNSEATINVVGEGTARLFVNAMLQFGHRALVNSPRVDQGGDVSKLLIGGYDEIRLNNRSTVSAAVYGFGYVRLGSPAYLYGEVSARKIAMNTDARICYGLGLDANARGV